MVAVSRREMRVIDSLMDEVARLAPALRSGDGYANVFDRDDDGRDWQIESRDESGACPFLFTRAGRALCAIHAIALTSGREVAAVKPQSCRHWPLIVESRRGGLRITVHPSAERIGCVAPLAALPGQPTIRDAFAAEIAELRSLVTRGRRRA